MFTEKPWTSNSKKVKDPETLSQLLVETGEKPRTPFEQKRVHEIKKLNNKVWGFMQGFVWVLKTLDGLRKHFPMPC